jgi:hypothetical protein
MQIEAKWSHQEGVKDVTRYQKGEIGDVLSVNPCTTETALQEDGLRPLSLLTPVPHLNLQYPEASNRPFI